MKLSDFKKLLGSKSTESNARQRTITRHENVGSARYVSSTARTSAEAQVNTLVVQSPYRHTPTILSASKNQPNTPKATFNNMDVVYEEQPIIPKATSSNTVEEQPIIPKATSSNTVEEQPIIPKATSSNTELFLPQPPSLFPKDSEIFYRTPQSLSSSISSNNSTVLSEPIEKRTVLMPQNSIDNPTYTTSSNNSQNSQDVTPANSPPRSRQGSITAESDEAPQIQMSDSLVVPQVVDTLDTVREQPDFAGGFNVNISFLAENKLTTKSQTVANHYDKPVNDYKPAELDYTKTEAGGGNNFGGGGGLKGYGGGGEGPDDFFFEGLPNVLLYTFIQQLLLQTTLSAFNKAYEKLESDLSNKVTTLAAQPRKNRFIRALVGIFCALAALFIAPKVTEVVVNKTANNISNAIRNVSSSLFKMFLYIVAFLAASVFAIKTISYVAYQLHPQLTQLCTKVWGPFVNRVILFLELCLKCFTASFLSDTVLTSIQKFVESNQYMDSAVFEDSFMTNRRIRILIPGITGICGLYLLYQDHIYIRTLCTKFTQSQTMAYLHNSQIGRITVLFGCTSLLKMSSALFPRAPLFFILYLCIFRVYVVAFSATGNFLPDINFKII